MTPQLMQAIKLLQLSNLDLAAYVEAELERNPLLERPAGEETRCRRGRTARRARRSGPAAAETPEAPVSRLDRRTGSTSRRRRSKSALDTGLDNVFPDEAPRPRAAQRHGRSGACRRYSEWARRGAGGRDDGDYNLEAFVAAETTLAGHLRRTADARHRAIRRERMIGQYLIDLVDEAGYLSGDLAGGRRKARHHARRDRGGAGACCRPSIRPASAPAISPNAWRSSCKERDRYDPAMQALVEHLDLLAKRDFAGAEKTLRRR